MKQYDKIKDEELIFRFKQGETEILDYLMEKYKNMVRKKARAMFLTVSYTHLTLPTILLV